VGIHEHDTPEDIEYCCKKLLACKLWENDSGAPWRHGVKQRDLEVLCVSQFTVSEIMRMLVNGGDMSVTVVPSQLLPTCNISTCFTVIFATALRQIDQEKST
jgi:hypothetical protein